MCSRDMTVTTCCFESVTEELKPRQFNHKDVYQQFEICPYFNGGFYARAVAWDGIPPKFLRRKGWEVHISHSFIKIHLREAQGLNPFQPHDIPKLNAPISSKRSTPIIIGKWYCPFVFVQEETSRQQKEQQMKKSLFYEVALKRWWEEIYACNNERNRSAGNVVAIDARVKKLLTLIDGMEASREPKTEPHDEFIWFSTAKERCERRVGLSSAIVEQLRWLQERRGWFADGDSDVRVEGSEEIKSESGWRRFGCYVLVESFVIRRMDGSLLMNFNCRDTRKIICTWE